MVGESHGILYLPRRIFTKKMCAFYRNPRHIYILQILPKLIHTEAGRNNPPLFQPPVIRQNNKYA